MATGLPGIKERDENLAWHELHARLVLPDLPPARCEARLMPYAKGVGFLSRAQGGLSFCKAKTSPYSVNLAPFTAPTNP